MRINSAQRRTAATLPRRLGVAAPSYAGSCRRPCARPRRLSRWPRASGHLGRNRGRINCHYPVSRRRRAKARLRCRKAQKNASRAYHVNGFDIRVAEKHPFPVLVAEATGSGRCRYGQLCAGLGLVRPPQGMCAGSCGTVLHHPLQGDRLRYDKRSSCARNTS
jgi:hypothetical protein